jgi:hypothetical protein
MSEGTVDFLVERSNLRKSRVYAGPPVELADGDALLSIDHFAFTANNITYAALGDRLSYWRFFPAADPWGRIPVWGFATVVRSRAPGLMAGERFYGFYPMSSHLVVAPSRIGAGGFVDGAAHRQGLPELYNSYRPAGPPDRAREAEEMIFRPLFATSFLLDDFLAENHRFGAGVVILSSASSKVSYGLAALLSRRGGCEVWGLTSSRNVGFVEGLGFYQRVVPYDAVGGLPTNLPAVFVDVAGDARVRRSVHARLPHLQSSIVVGETHWEAADSEEGDTLPGPEPFFFFAPTHLARRAQSWGPGGLRQRLDEAWQIFIPTVRSWLRVVEARGADAVSRVYAETLENRAPADVGQVLSLHS